MKTFAKNKKINLFNKVALGIFVVLMLPVAVADAQSYDYTGYDYNTSYSYPSYDYTGYDYNTSYTYPSYDYTGYDYNTSYSYPSYDYPSYDYTGYDYNTSYSYPSYDYTGYDYTYPSYDYTGYDYAYPSYDYTGYDYIYPSYDYTGYDYIYPSYDYTGYDYTYPSYDYTGYDYAYPSYDYTGYDYTYPSYDYPDYSYNYPDYGYGGGYDYPDYSYNYPDYSYDYPSYDCGSPCDYYDDYPDYDYCDYYSCEDFPDYEPPFRDFDVVCRVSDTNIEKGDRVTFTADVFGSPSGSLEYRWNGDVRGDSRVETERFTREGRYHASVTVTDRYGKRESDDCPVVIVDREYEHRDTPVVIYQPPALPLPPVGQVASVSSVFLDQIPVTGFDMTPLEVTIYATLLALWSIAVAYFIQKRRKAKQNSNRISQFKRLNMQTQSLA